MSDANDIYHPPQHISNTALRDELVDFLDGENLDSRISQAIGLSTVDERGWPHAAMLSAGDMTALDHLRRVHHLEELGARRQAYLDVSVRARPVRSTPARDRKES
jgi:hypothetical protein